MSESKHTPLMEWMREPDHVENASLEWLLNWVNRRPIAAAAAHDDMLAALEPFADVDGEGDEDFSDDTKVTITFGRSTHYAVKLGDFRRARAAIAKAEGQS